MAGLTTTTAGLPDNFPRRLEILGPNTTAKPFVPSRSGRASSTFRGVSSQGSRWRARICVSKVEYTIGDFDSEDAAAKAYDVEAIKRGKFHQLNFIYRNLNDTPENVQRLREAQRRSRRANNAAAAAGNQGQGGPVVPSGAQGALPVVQQQHPQQQPVPESAPGAPSGGSAGGPNPGDDSVNDTGTAKQDGGDGVLGVLTIPREDRVMKARLKVRRSRGEAGEGQDGRRPASQKHSSFPAFHHGHGGPGGFPGYMGGLPEAFPSARWGPGVMPSAHGGHGPWAGAAFGGHPSGFILPGPPGHATGQYPDGPWSSGSFPQSQGLAQGLDDSNRPTKDRQQNPHPFGSPSPFAPMGMARPPMGMHPAPSSGMYFGHGPSMNGGSMMRLANTDAGDGPFGSLQHGPLPLPWHAMHMHTPQPPPSFDPAGRRQQEGPPVSDSAGHPVASGAEKASTEVPTTGSNFPPFPPPSAPQQSVQGPTSVAASSSSSTVAAGEGESHLVGAQDRQEAQAGGMNGQSSMPMSWSAPDTTPSTTTQSNVRTGPNQLSFGFTRPLGRTQGAAAYGNPNMMPLSYDAPHRAFVSMGSSVGTEYVPQAPQAGMARPHVPIWRDGGDVDSSRSVSNNPSGQHRERSGLDALAAVTEVMQGSRQDGAVGHSSSVAAADQKNVAALENGRAEYKRLLEFLRHPRTQQLLPPHIRQKLKVVVFTGGPQTVATFLSAIDVYDSNPEAGLADLLDTLEHMYASWSRAAVEMGVLADPNAALAGPANGSSPPHDAAATSHSSATSVAALTPPAHSSLSAGLSTSSVQQGPPHHASQGAAMASTAPPVTASVAESSPQIQIQRWSAAPVGAVPESTSSAGAMPSSSSGPTFATGTDNRMKRPANAMDSATETDAPAAKRVHL